MRLAVLLLGCSGANKVDSRETGPAPDSRDSSSDSPAETGDSDSPSDTGCGTPTTQYRDADGDGHGTAEEVVACEGAPGTSTLADDCDDARATVFPGAPELATSGRDDDCDGRGGAAEVVGVPSWAATDGTGYYVSFGQRAALPGDLTGDGFPDLVVTNPSSQDRAGAWQGGAAYVFHGPLVAGATEHLQSEAQTILYGTAPDGIEVATLAGDVDGDGHPDLLLGGYQRAQGGDGIAYLVRGPLAEEEASLAETAQAYQGLWEQAGLALSVGPFNANDDGLDDLVLSAYDGADRNGGYGEVYVMHGPVGHSSVSEAETTLRGEENENLGSKMTIIGDVDGDGRDDLGLLHSLSTDPSIYVVLEAPQGIYHPTDVGVNVLADASGSWRPGALIPTPVGDVDEDGYADLGVAFGPYDGSYLPILLGPLGPPSADISADWDILLLSDNGGLGYTDLSFTAPLGDWDGDGHDDLAAGNAWYAKEKDRADCYYGTCLAGAVFLLAGPLRAGTIDLEMVADRIDPPWRSQTFGEVLAGGEDVDADGFPDLAIGDPDNSYAFVLFGGGLR